MHHRDLGLNHDPRTPCCYGEDYLFQLQMRGRCEAGIIFSVSYCLSFYDSFAVKCTVCFINCFNIKYV